jgi:hypothetical protein
LLVERTGLEEDDLEEERLDEEEDEEGLDDSPKDGGWSVICAEDRKLGDLVKRWLTQPFLNPWAIT